MDHEDADAETIALAVAVGRIVAPLRFAWIIGQFREAAGPQQLVGAADTEVIGPPDIHCLLVSQ